MTRYQSVQKLDEKDAIEVTLLHDIGAVLAKMLSCPGIDEPSSESIWRSQAIAWT